MKCIKNNKEQDYYESIEDIKIIKSKFPLFKHVFVIK